MSRWADMLEGLPTIKQSEDDYTMHLKIETERMRVWLCDDENAVANGNPFPRTVYVEECSTGFWQDIGYFDGDEEDPEPAGFMRDAWILTQVVAL